MIINEVRLNEKYFFIEKITVSKEYISYSSGIAQLLISKLLEINNIDT